MFSFNETKVSNDILKVIAATLERIEALMQPATVMTFFPDNSTSRKPSKAKSGTKR